MAQDQIEVMEKLGYREFFVAGHDRGARTTARMCLDRPKPVKRAALIDILPNHAHPDVSHDPLVALGIDGPALSRSACWAGTTAQYFMEKKLSKPGIGLGFFDPEAFAEYVRCFNWKTIKGSCAQAARHLRLRDGHSRFRTAAVGDLGAKSHTEGVHGDVLAVWQRDYATRLGGALPAATMCPRRSRRNPELRHFAE